MRCFARPVLRLDQMNDEPLIIDRTTGLEVQIVEKGDLHCVVQLPDGKQVERPSKDIVIHWPW